jgi:hypothetical protein
MGCIGWNHENAERFDARHRGGCTVEDGSICNVDWKAIKQSPVRLTSR